MSSVGGVAVAANWDGSWGRLPVTYVFRGKLRDPHLWHLAQQRTVQRVYNQASQYHQDLLNFLEKHRCLMRQILVEDGYLRSATRLGDIGVEKHLSAVDSSARQVVGYATSYLVGVALSVNSRQDCHGIFYDLHCPNSFSLGVLVDYLRAYLESILLNPQLTVGDYYVILDQSFAVVLSHIYNALRGWFTYHDELLSYGIKPWTDDFTKSWFDLLYAGLGEESSFLRMFGNPKVIGVTKQATANTIVRMLQKVLMRRYTINTFGLNLLNDRRLLDILMEPGEYLTPQPLAMNRNVYENLLDIYDKVPKNYQNYFRSLPDICSFFGKLGCRDGTDGEIYYTYYFPFSGSRVYRLEFCRNLLCDNGCYDYYGGGSTFQELLNCFNCSLLPDFMEPYNQYLVDKRVKDEVGQLEEFVRYQEVRLQDEYLRQVKDVTPLDLRYLQLLSYRYRT